MANKYEYRFVGVAPTAYDFKNKEKHIAEYIAYMLARTQMIFKWENLPDTIPERMLELYLQTNGNCIIGKHDNDLYAFVGGYGGEPDAYYQPTLYVVANPYLKFDKTFKIDDDCVLIRNDSLLIGLMPLFNRYATALTENDLSMNLVDINTRISSLISATDDRTKQSAEIYLDKIKQGEMGIIAETALLESIKVQPYATITNSQIKNLIEYHQYLKASWYNEIGLNANFNMKREAINGEEAGMNEQALLPLIDNMLIERQQACEKINAMFGTNISVKLTSAWEDVQEATEIIEPEQDIAKSDEEVTNDDTETN